MEKKQRTHLYRKPYVCAHNPPHPKISITALPLSPRQFSLLHECDQIKKIIATFKKTMLSSMLHIKHVHFRLDWELTKHLASKTQNTLPNSPIFFYSNGNADV